MFCTVLLVWPVELLNLYLGEHGVVITLIRQPPIWHQCPTDITAWLAVTNVRVMTSLASISIRRLCHMTPGKWRRPPVSVEAASNYCQQAAPCVSSITQTLSGQDTYLPCDNLSPCCPGRCRWESAPQEMYMLLNVIIKMFIELLATTDSQLLLFLAQ